MAKQEICKVENCNQKVRAKGYCSRHYNQWRKGKLGKARYKTCHEEGCLKPMKLKGYCQEHYDTVYLKKPAKTEEEKPAEPTAEQAEEKA